MKPPSRLSGVKSESNKRFTYDEDLPGSRLV